MNSSEILNQLNLLDPLDLLESLIYRIWNPRLSWIPWIFQVQTTLDNSNCLNLKGLLDSIDSLNSPKKFSETWSFLAPLNLWLFSFFWAQQPRNKLGLGRSLGDPWKLLESCSKKLSRGHQKVIIIFFMGLLELLETLGSPGAAHRAYRRMYHFRELGNSFTTVRWEDFK